MKLIFFASGIVLAVAVGFAVANILASQNYARIYNECMRNPLILEKNVTKDDFRVNCTQNRGCYISWCMCGIPKPYVTLTDYIGGFIGSPCVQTCRSDCLMPP